MSDMVLVTADPAGTLVLSQEGIEKYLQEKLNQGVSAAAVAKYRTPLLQLLGWLEKEQALQPDGSEIQTLQPDRTAEQHETGQHTEQAGPSPYELTREKLQQWRQHLEACGYSKITVQTYVKEVNDFLRTCGHRELCIARPLRMDLRGQTFGYLTALEPIHSTSRTLPPDKQRRRNILWHCVCRCGGEVDVPATMLTCGHTTSCGCLNIEILKHRNRYVEGTSLRQALEDRRISKYAASGYTGVTAKRGKWQACITYKGVHYYLGTYGDINDAVKARAKQLVMEDAAKLYEEYKDNYGQQPGRARGGEDRPEKRYEDRRKPVELHPEQRLRRKVPGQTAEDPRHHAGRRTMSEVLHHKVLHHKILHNRLLAALGLVCLMLFAQPIKAHAAEPEILKLKGADTVQNRAFAVENMFPGDAESKEFTIKTSHKDRVTLYFQASVREGYEKLAEVMKVKVELPEEQEILYDGLMKEMSPALSHELEAGKQEVLYRITACLDTSVGNAYQNKKLVADLKWWYAEETGDQESGGPGETEAPGDEENAGDEGGPGDEENAGGEGGSDDEENAGDEGGPGDEETSGSADGNGNAGGAAGSDTGSDAGQDSPAWTDGFPSLPRTGDNTPMILYITLCIGAAAAIFFLLLIPRRNKHKEKDI